MADGAVVEAGLLDLLRHLAHAGHHRHHPLHAAHLQHLLELHLEVVHVEAALLKAADHPLGLLGLDGLAGLFDEGDDVSHAEDASGDARWVEGFEILELLAGADELDRLAGHRPHGERRPAAGIAVHPRQDNAGDADLVGKLAGDIDRVLAGEAVHHEQGLGGLDRVAHRRHLGHQRRVDMEPAGGV